MHFKANLVRLTYTECTKTVNYGPIYVRFISLHSDRVNRMFS